ncbi:MAG: CopG family transcriptional regulator [Angustibacter sp.]
MRTTVTLDHDVSAAVAHVRNTEGVGVSEAVNRLIRAGLVAPNRPRRFRQRSARLGLRVDVSNVSEALDELEGPTSR